MPPFGKSDHNAILLTGCYSTYNQLSPQIGFRRRLDRYALNNIAYDLVYFSWQQLYRLNDCQKQAELFYAVLHDIVDRHAPLLKTKLRSHDKPWITEYFKCLITRRNKAYTSGSVVLYKKLRHQVNQIRKTLKTQYYLGHVQCLNPRVPNGGVRSDPRPYFHC
jgi:hypothetical protein